MAKRDSMLEFALASMAAEQVALAQRCRPLQVYNMVVLRSRDNSYIEGIYSCRDEHRVCEEYMWQMNAVLEHFGYTTIWRVSSERYHFRAYRRAEEMIPIREVAADAGR